MDPELYLRKSKCETGQEWWAWEQSHFRLNGFFVELGAWDGYHASNTLFLERYARWSGVLIEPGETGYSRLIRNRNAHCSNDLCSNVRGNVPFMEVGGNLPWQSGTRSGIVNEHSGKVIGWMKTPPKTRLAKKLTDVLIGFSAPRFIDYLSLDVEGHEPEVLEGLDFKWFQIKCMSIENNREADLKKILEPLGYKQVKKFSDKDRGWLKVS